MKAPAMTNPVQARSAIQTISSRINELDGVTATIAVAVEEHVVGLQVSMQYASAVCERDRLTHVDEPAQQSAKLPGQRVGPRVLLVVRLDGLLEAIPLNEAHGIKRPAVSITAETVDRHDSRMLQPTVNLSLKDETGSEAGFRDLVGSDLLESDLTPELLVTCHEDTPKAPLSVEANDAESVTDASSGGRGARRRFSERSRCRGFEARLKARVV